MPVTVPVLWKRYVFNSTATDSSVRCDATACTKTFADDTVYRRERDVYAMGLPYVPRMLSHDDTARTLTVERVGKPLRDRWNFGPAPTQYDARVEALSRRFTADTGLVHGDVDYANVLRDDQDRLLLIDFEYATPIASAGARP